MNDKDKMTEAEKIFVGGGQMGSLMRLHDWSQTLLGPLDGWTQSLRIAVSICLNSRFPMVIWWGEELVLLYNDAWCTMLGTKHPQSLGKPGREVWGEIWEIIGVQLNSVLKTGQPTWSDDSLLLVDRFGYTEEAYFTYSYSPIFLESGKVGGAFTAVNETTQRVIGERRLGTLRELSAQIGSVNSVRETCLLATSRLTTNPHDISLALLYLVENEGREARLVGTTGLEIGTPISPEQISLTQALDCWNLNQVKETGEAKLIKNLVTRFGLLPGGVWQESADSALVMPIGQSGQHLAGFMILGISPRRIFDDEYRGFFDLVASQVTIMIANAKAHEEERKRAEALAELDRSKTAFFSNVSHEFRTPLTLMLGPLEGALSVADDTPFATQRQSLELVHRNALRLLKLVNTLLDFSRIEAGRIQATYEPIDLAIFTSELASVFRSAIEQEGEMRLVLNCPPLPEPVYVDREMWEKIVFNLLSNAFKSTFVGEITVTLRSTNEQVELLVSDTGIGIPTDELPHIFERFHRVKEAKGRTCEGTGIGLSLVQDLARLHGGTVEVTSIVGQGSCFKVAIPKGASHLPQDRISSNADPATSKALRVAPVAKDVLSWLPDRGVRKLEKNTSVQSHPHSCPTRILLADDNADMREYIKRILSESYEVETVVDGLSALETINQRPPDLVVTDLMMPGLDGLELLQEVRANPKTREIPIILLSARAGEESRVEGLKYGADDYLIKPFSARELLARIEANLKMFQMRQEATQKEQTLRIEAQTAKEQMENVLSRIDDLFLALDDQWCYTYLNNRVVELVGKPTEELLGKNIWEVFPDLVDSKFYLEVNRAMAEQVIVQFEYFYRPWQRWFENRVYPSSNGVSIFSADITERKETENDLAEQKVFLHNLTNTVPVLLWTACPDGTIDFVSQPWIEYTGMDLTEVNRQGWSNLIHPDDLAQTRESWNTAWQRRDPYEMTHRVKRADGSYNWCISRAVLTGDEELNSLRWVE